MFVTSRVFFWAGPLAVTLLAAVLRLWNLGVPHGLVFDETFYVKDAWTLNNLGYESTWPEGADALFAAGQTDVFLSDPSFVVHPPLGKWLIALGMAVVGPEHSWGWRIATALIGVLAVVLLMLIAKKLFGSTVLAVIAGFLFAIDGNAIVMSRVALLDNSVMFFALLGFGAVLLDRDRHATRLSARLVQAREAGREPGWGPTLWRRPWLLAAGLAFGLACSVKWSGIYFLAAFGVYLVLVDALARRRAGLPFWFSAAVLKQAPATFLLIVPVAVATYLASWTGWFVTRGGYYRDWATTPDAAWTGALAWIPDSVQSFWHYQVAAYTYHVGLSTPHPYQANPLTWLFMSRPTSMYYRGSALGENGCDVATCSEAITGIANPMIWWAATAAAFYLVYRLARYREWQVGLILMGLVAGYLPWLMYLNRTVFQFYTIAFEPYLLLGLTFVIGVLLPRARWVVLGFLVAAALLSAYFYPLWTGIQTPFTFWQLHIWLPSWR
ncbi:phospholipid carrier-dependent glycosyltransferase [Cryobacterium sp. Sr3]|uniref:dolichyl-phosphate-mannose--protein mannosyltransferase n=1 Tax=Cryobacterium sp. Sr3 TaxID=1259194 RepID=UPI00106A0A77|nr:phospholipid carrier-dependent glycosyltransferase [Cryobacterium sp. Sr3]TFB54454.1 phospholipid carrier-dependent glycosyltransferase [Cryobacterium sp. Sr3]